MSIEDNIVRAKKQEPFHHKHNNLNLQNF